MEDGPTTEISRPKNVYGILTLVRLVHLSFVIMTVTWLVHSVRVITGVFNVFFAPALTPTQKKKMLLSHKKYVTILRISFIIQSVLIFLFQ